MPYLALDLDAKKRCERIAKARGLHPGAVIYALLELWETAWRERRAELSQLEVLGGVGPDRQLVDDFCEMRFLEQVERGYRVRGADRYLRIKKAQSDAGKKHADNLRKGTGGAGKPPDPPKGHFPGVPRVDPEVDPENFPGSYDRRSTIDDRSLDHSEGDLPCGTSKKGDPPPHLKKLIGLLDLLYQRRRAPGDCYPWNDDDRERLRMLLDRFSPQLIAAKWLDALGDPRRESWPHIANLKQLEQHWAEFSPAPPVVAQFDKDFAPASDAGPPNNVVPLKANGGT